MISKKLASIGLAASLVAILPAVSAHAQSPRTFVSAAGNDSNPCSFAAPCRHFQAAVNATSAGGEVDALDPAGYGPIVISQAVTIEGQGWSYIAPPAGGNGITINAVSGNVVIHGVSLNGAGIGGTNEPAIRLAEKIVGHAYANSSGVYFTTAGAESNESAFKFARYYWKLQDKPDKTKIISRFHAYHGVTMAAMSATGMAAFHKMFGPLVPGFIQVQPPYAYRWQGNEDPGIAAAEAVEKAMRNGSFTAS